jgi:CRISPR/Cas system endoribonuclease Cas6 (RAMP superfamily)
MKGGKPESSDALKAAFMVSLQTIEAPIAISVSNSHNPETFEFSTILEASTVQNWQLFKGLTP